MGLIHSSDPAVHALQFLDVINMKDPTQKAHFYRSTLKDALPFIPRVSIREIHFTREIRHPARCIIQILIRTPHGGILIPRLSSFNYVSLIISPRINICEFTVNGIFYVLTFTLKGNKQLYENCFRFFRNLFTSHPTTSKSLELFSSAFRQIMSTGLFASDVVQLLSILKFREILKFAEKSWIRAGRREPLLWRLKMCKTGPSTGVTWTPLQQCTFHSLLLDARTILTSRNAFHLLFRLKFEYPSGRNLKKSSELERIVFPQLFWWKTSLIMISFHL